MSELPTTMLGRTGFEVTKLGYGAMELRAADDGSILHDVLDSGINLIDTSPDYGNAEEIIGAVLEHRRDEYFLASKCGCHTGPGPETSFEHDYSPRNVRACVEQSLRRMRTDRIDLVQFHWSPSRTTLESEGSVEALVALRDEGKVRFLGMSGTLPDLPDQIKMGVFDTFQIPYSALEREHEELMSVAAGAGAGVIGRGGVAKGVPTGEAVVASLNPNRKIPRERVASLRDAIDARRNRFDEADVGTWIGEMDVLEFLLRFTISHPDLHTTIVGTKNPTHLRANVEAAKRGALPDDLYQEAKRRLA